MNIVRCLACGDTFVPQTFVTSCSNYCCEAEYLPDRRTLEVRGDCVVLGLGNSSLAAAIARWTETRAWPKGAPGRTQELNFKAWVIPEDSQWVKRVDEFTSKTVAREKRNAARRTSRKK